ncbi:MAG: hypothetical protein M0T70_02935 [Geobacteraceae bacterium]|nr:hypothetical protein [Geobacteraceae bacterium]
MRIAFYKYHTPGVMGLFARFTRFITGGPYSHCELIFSDGQAFSASIQDGGTRYKRIDFDPAKWDIMEIASQQSRARAFCDEEKGCKYDFIGICRFIFPWAKESKTRWFCSEVCTAALQKAGVITAVIPASIVHPMLLYWLLIVYGARRVHV